MPSGSMIRVSALALVGVSAGFMTGELMGAGAANSDYGVGTGTAAFGDPLTQEGGVVVWAPRQVAAPGDLVRVVAESPDLVEPLVVAVESTTAVVRTEMEFDGKWLWTGEFVAEPGVLRYRVETASGAVMPSEWSDLSVAQPVDLNVNMSSFDRGRSWSASIGRPGSGADFEIEDMAEGARMLPPAFVITRGQLFVLDQWGSAIAEMGASGVVKRTHLYPGIHPFDLVVDGDGSLVLSDPLNSRIVRIDERGRAEDLPAPAFRYQFQADNSKLHILGRSEIRLEAPIAAGLVDPAVPGRGSRGNMKQEDVDLVLNVYDGRLHLLVDGEYLRITVPGSSINCAEDLVVDKAKRVWVTIGVVNGDGTVRELLARVDSRKSEVSAIDIGFLDGDVTRRLARANNGVVVLTQANPSELMWVEQS